MVTCSYILFTRDPTSRQNGAGYHFSRIFVLKFPERDKKGGDDVENVFYFFYFITTLFIARRKFPDKQHPAKMIYCAVSATIGSWKRNKTRSSSMHTSFSFESESWFKQICFDSFSEFDSQREIIFSWLFLTFAGFRRIEAPKKNISVEKKNEISSLQFKFKFDKTRLNPRIPKWKSKDSYPLLPLRKKSALAIF